MKIMSAVHTCGSLLSLLLLAAHAHAAPVTLDITATINSVSGSYVGNLSGGQSIFGTFLYDTDEANADPGAQTSPSTVPGHEFSSFYEFTGPPYGMSLTIPAVSGSFSNTTPLGVVVNDNLSLTAGDTNGLLPAGTYDWIELLGSTTTSVCLQPGGSCAPDEFSPADGEEWTLALFSDAGWFSDGSVIPDNVPASYTALVVGLEFDSAGNEIGAVFATVDTLNVSAVPIPAAAWLFGSGLLCLAGVSCRKGQPIT